MTTSDDAASALRSGLARHVLERSSEPVVVLNAAGHLVLANRAAAELLGCAETLVGCEWRDLVHPDDVEVVDRARLGRSDEPVTDLVVRLRHEDGAYRRAALTIDGGVGCEAVPMTLVAARQLDRADDDDTRGVDPATGWPWLSQPAAIGPDDGRDIAGAIAIVVAAGDATLGVTGDRVREIAGIVSTHLADGDVAARGVLGELVVVPARERGDVGQVAARLVDALAGSATQVRLGIADAGAGADPTTVIGRAIAAARCAERDATPPSASIGADRRRRRLRRAIDERDLGLDLQPIVDITTGRIGGLEAILRIGDETIDTMPEQDDELAASVERFVIDRSIELAGLVQRSFPEGAIFVAAPVDASGLGRPGFARHVERTLGVHAIEPQRWCLQLSDVRSRLDESGLDRIAALRRAGARIALDGFGHRPSSLADVERVRPDLVRLDPSVIAELGADRTTNRLVAGLIGVASAVDADVVAVGVESEQQRFELSKLGCPLIQGRLFAPPTGWDGIVALLEQARRGVATRVPDRLAGRVRPPGSG